MFDKRFGLLVVILSVVPHQAQALERDEALKALSKAVDYYTANVATEGGYLYLYSEDLTKRRGEHAATETMVWVQPPGTPSVGQAYLDAYEATGETKYLEAAKAAASALVRGQLRSGGWQYSIEFDPEKRTKYSYRVPPASESGKNSSVLDDNNTQSAIRFLMHLDVALDFKDDVIHEAVLFALDSLITAQYPNGAWPQRYTGRPDSATHPVLRASYPSSWSRTFPKVDYYGHYTFNDNAMGDTVEVMIEAADTYHAPKYREAAKRCGDFLLLALMPEPQTAWAQQYDAEMHPAWARKFEPPSITGGESQSNAQTLMKIYRATGEKKYLEPVPEVLAYLERSLLPDGTLARFYELETNRPLYFTRDYELTYSDADMPTHYKFKVSAKLGNIRKEFDRVSKLTPEQLQKPSSKKKISNTSPEMMAEAERAIRTLDDRGRWIEEARFEKEGPDVSKMRVLSMYTYVRNLQALTDYLDATKK